MPTDSDARLNPSKTGLLLAGWDRPGPARLVAPARAAGLQGSADGTWPAGPALSCAHLNAGGIGRFGFGGVRPWRKSVVRTGGRLTMQDW